jgi:nickel-dependent lactate racemase
MDAPADVAVVFQPDGFLNGAMGATQWADRAVRLGGTIIVLAPARQGWSNAAAVEARLAPDEGLMRKTAAELAWIVADRDVQALRLATAVFDFRRTMLEKRVVLVSAGYDRAATEALGMEFAPDLDSALADALERHGADARVLLMPEATRTLPVPPKLEGVVWSETQVWSGAAPTLRQPDHA